MMLMRKVFVSLRIRDYSRVHDCLQGLSRSLPEIFIIWNRECNDSLIPASQWNPSARYLVGSVLTVCRKP